MAVSTFCRACGSHFEIDGTPSKKANDSKAEKPAAFGHGLMGKIFGNRHRPNGAAFSVSRKASSQSPLGSITSPLSHLIQSFSGKPAGPVSVRCFDCNHTHKVSQPATSTICPSCICYICLEDIVVTEQQIREIRTRGNVTVKKGVTLIGGIACHHLRIYGKVLGQLDCSGELHFLSNGRTLSVVTAQKIIIHSRCEVNFVHAIKGEEVEIQGTGLGKLHCNGRLHIGKKGHFVGKVTTRSLSVDSGGSLSGQLNIINDKTTAEPKAEEHTPLKAATPRKEENATEAVPV